MGLSARFNRQLYVEIRRKEYLTLNLVMKCMEETKPDGLNAESWQELTEHWRHAYMAWQMDILLRRRFAPRSPAGSEAEVAPRCIVETIA